MNKHMEQIKHMLIVAEVPGVEEWDTDDTVFSALQDYIKSLQDIACKSDTWRLAAENHRRDFEKIAQCHSEIKQALIDSEDVPIDGLDVDSVVSTVKLALEYLKVARDSARMYSSQLETERGNQSLKINAATRELREKIDVLESQVAFHRDTVKNLEGANEGLATALRIVLDTRGH